MDDAETIDYGDIAWAGTQPQDGVCQRCKTESLVYRCYNSLSEVVALMCNSCCFELVQGHKEN